MTVDGPRLATPDEFGQIAALLNSCFGFEGTTPVERLPHCFDPNHIERHAVVVEDDTVVSHAVCVPVRLVAGSAAVNCAGIAGVATNEMYRGRGFMTDLLEFWLDRTDERNIPLVELEGDRTRYGRFGWENAGREYRYTVTRRSCDPPASTGSYSHDVYKGADDDIDLIRRLHETERFRVRRDRAMYRLLLGQHGLETLLRRADDGPAYVSYRTRESTVSILEFGGTRTGIHALIDDVFRRQSPDELVLYSPVQHPHHDLFRDVASHWELIPHRKLNVRSLDVTMKAFIPLIRDRWEWFGTGHTGTVSIGIEGGDAIELAYGDGTVECESSDGTPDVSLSRREMAGFLFGFPDQWRTITSLDPFLRTVLPLDYYFWETETI